MMLQDRRTRISEKLRKLQALVPNMDKVIHYTLSVIPCCRIYDIFVSIYIIIYAVHMVAIQSIFSNRQQSAGFYRHAHSSFLSFCSLKCGSKLAQRTCWIQQLITSEDSRASCRYMYVLINTFSTYIYIYIYGQKTEAASASQLLHCSIKNTNTHEAVDLRCTSIHDDFSITLGPPIIWPSMSLSFDRSTINYVSTSFCLINAFMNELKEAISILYNILLQFHPLLIHIHIPAHILQLSNTEFYYMHLQALKEDKEKCTCRGNRPPGR